MAVIDSTGIRIPGPVGKATLVSWLAMTTGDTGAPTQSPQYSDRSVQLDGTFGGATVTIQGSNDGVNWYTLTDTAGVAATFTVAGLKQLLQVSRYIRPSISGGAAANLNVNLLIVGKS